ncbi:MAG: hypothetical protein JXA54_08230 [Candidatus Heimdallarchaeota archaeon]|nr:hypothetical protein [Candidatus Heimdallarchaeota archaeon]
MSEYRIKLGLKKLSIIVSISVLITIILEIILITYVENYFFGSILIPVVLIWIIIGIIEFLTRGNREEKNRPKAAKVIQVKSDAKIEDNSNDSW